MPNYSFELTAPINTPIATPVTREIVLAPGTLDRCEIQFPSGCAGLVGAQVWKSMHQLYPTNDGAWFISDGYTIPVSDQQLIDEPPYALTLRVYNLDDTYPHTITFRVNLLRSQDTLATKIRNALRVVQPPSIET